jgi:hypothetical protein
MQMGYDFDDQVPGTGQTARIARFAGADGGLDDAVAGAGGDSPALRTPDWSALRARFLAIHGLRASLATRDEAVLPCGGFLEDGGAVLASCRRDGEPVNPVYSANGKAVRRIIPPVAASPSVGARGMQ